MEAVLAGSTEEPVADATPWWSRHGRSFCTLGSGLALAAAMAFKMVGPRLGANADLCRQIALSGFALAVVFGGAWLYPRAVRGLRQFRLDIEVLMGLAILGAIGLGQWDEAATVAFLFGLSEWLESRSLDRARRAIRNLLEIAPVIAERIEPDGTVQKVPASLIRAGDRVLVRSGDTIPIDGTVRQGRSSVDQKAITGESVPVERGPGDPVYAGTTSGEGTLEVEASGPASEALITRIVRQVREAQAGRAVIERRISRFAHLHARRGPLVGPGHGRTAARLAGRKWRPGRGVGAGSLARLVLQRAHHPGDRLSLPALVIATPVAVVSGLAAAARSGVLIKGGEFLEEIGRLRAGVRQDGHAYSRRARRGRGCLCSRHERSEPRSSDRRRAGRPGRPRAGQGDRSPRPRFAAGCAAR